MVYYLKRDMIQPSVQWLKISNVVRQSKCRIISENTDSSLSENTNSDDEMKLPKLSYIRSSRQIQRQIDQSVAKLGKKPDGGYGTTKSFLAT